MKQYKIVIWCGEAANQRALANKLAMKFPVAGIVIDKKTKLKKPGLIKRFFTALTDKLFFSRLQAAWSAMIKKYNSLYPSWPDVPVLWADSVNDKAVFEFTQQLEPDLIIVSGTGLVKEKNLSVKTGIGIVNLHTGLSPYIKGGPNCTNWCIATDQFEKIGNTIMWIDKGIDSGNIITSEATPLSMVTDLVSAQWVVMEHAHDLYGRAVSYLLTPGTPKQSIPQNQLGAGKLYLTKHWNFRAKRNLIKNLDSFIDFCSRPQPRGLITIPLPDLKK